jgi:hypothetical protein
LQVTDKTHHNEFQVLQAQPNLQAVLYLLHTQS